MLPRPAWLAVGVTAAAGAGVGVGATAVAQGAIAPDAAPTVAAASISAAILAAACVCGLARRPAWAPRLAVAALGAAIVAARLAAGAALGGAAGGSPGTAPLPAGTDTWQATVIGAHATKGVQIATIEIAAPPLTCSANLPAYPRLIGGDVVSWSGRIRPLTQSAYDDWLASQGITASCEATEVALLAHDDSPAGRLEGFRQASGDALQRVLPEPEGGLAAAILIGLRDRVDKEVAADFTTAGVSHIVAISGWNIAIVAATVAALLGSLVGRRRRAVVTLAAIVAYTLFAGASPSVN